MNGWVRYCATFYSRATRTGGPANQRWTFVLLLLLCTCTPVSEPRSGSETHFLSSCAGSCPATYTCSCGVCTLPCSSDRRCAAEHAGATCSHATPGDACRAAASMCDVACHLDADCGSLGGNFTCLSGQCRERVANEPVTEAEVPAAIGVVTGSDASTKDSGATLNDSGATLNDSGANADGGASSDAFVADEVLCDGSDTMRLSLQSGAGGWVPSTTLWFATPYGDQVLLVDGQCRYYATGGDPLLGMRTGVLTTAQASELANAIGWSKLASWSTLFADAGPSCEDASGSVIRRPGVAARSCVCGCDPNLTPELSAAIAQVGPWTDRLVSAGEALTGPVTALAVRVPMPANDEFAWPLGRHIMAIPDLESGKAAVPYDQGARFELADEVAALRDLRARQRARADPKITDYIPVSDMGASYHVAVRDELPDAAQRAFDVLVGSVTR